MTEEQLVNGGFETGDFTGWTTTRCIIRTVTPYEGLYYGGAEYHSLPLGYYPFNIQQVVNNIVVDSSTEVFVWVRHLHNGKFRITYTDSSFTEVGTSLSAIWVKYTISPTIGKTIKEIRLYKTTYSNDACHFDKFSLLHYYPTWGYGNVGLRDLVGDKDYIIDYVLDWHEEEEVPIPIKRIVRKESPTTQAEYFTRLPRRIELELKSSRSEKENLEACKHCHSVVELYDYDASFVDCVWIERLNYKWVGDRDHNYPWRGRMTLLCSST